MHNFHFDISTFRFPSSLIPRHSSLVTHPSPLIPRPSSLIQFVLPPLGEGWGGAKGLLVKERPAESEAEDSLVLWVVRGEEIVSVA